MKRYFRPVSLLLVFILQCCLCISSVEAKTVQFTILTFNDFYTVERSSDGRGGFAGLSTLLKQQRANSRYSITTVNGDFLFPSILSSYDKGAHRVDLMNDLKVDLVVLGNHEFDFGIDVLNQRMGESKFRYLTANAFNLDNKPFTGDQQTYIVDVEGVKIGFFGLITVETPLLSSTEKKVNFTPVSYTARQMVRQLKNAGADVIVALTHLFIDDDRKLAQEVPEIDLILGGHDHEPISWYNGRTFVHKSGQNAYFLTRIDLTIDKNEQTSKVMVYPTWEVICNCLVPQDPVIAEKIATLEERFDAFALEPIAVVKERLDSTNPAIRTKETSMGNLVADAIRFTCEADAAIIGGGLIRGDKIYEPGTVITLKDLLSELPFSNLNMVVEITGKEILEALENGVSQVEGKAGRFPQVSGIQYAFDLGHKPGKRVCDVKINGKPLDPLKFYKVATVDYMYNGGDGYNSFRKGRVLLDDLQHQETVQCVIEYVKKLGEIAYRFEERIICYECSCTLDDKFVNVSGGGVGSY
ncbi:MAG: bifunctional metallophosphatase/5'-nucleotidase [Verrucomicrobia bacterium]|nr:bifunctional metallophosphatase/5'-nucleotidase [Verrucomicrobiota bacterium]